MPPAHPLVTGPIFATLVRLATPNLLAMVATALVSVAETAYVGQLGIAALAGMALVFPWVMLQQMLSSGSIGGGISSAVSRALGAGDEAKAAGLARHAAWIGIGVGLAFTVLMLGLGATLYALIGGRDEALDQALAYSNVAFLGATSIWLTNALASVVRGTGNMKVPSATLLAVAVLQVVLGGSLGLGLGPLPRLGMAGVAMGQVVAFTLGGAYLWVYLHSDRGRVRLSMRGPLSRALFHDILKVGGVASISSLQTVLTILILTRIVARLGTNALAGYGIGTRLEFLLIPITFAIGVACVPMVGMAMGAGLVPRARRVAWTGALLAGAIVGCLGLLVAIVPDAWTTLFTQRPEVLAVARTYFHWTGPCFGFFALGLCLYFASQGAGKLTGPVLAGTLRLVMVAVGGTWLVQTDAGPGAVFALIAAAMVAYGLATAASVAWVRWER